MAKLSNGVWNKPKNVPKFYPENNNPAPKMPYDDDNDKKWRSEIADVVPLKDKSGGEGSLPKISSDNIFADDISSENPCPNCPDAPKNEKNALKSPKKTFEPKKGRDIPSKTSFSPLVVHQHTAHVISGSVTGFDKKLLKKIASGTFGFSDRLDLHGFFETQAHVATNDFLHEMADAEHRCVIIIHGKGKGYGEKRDMGVIKFSIAKWLAYHPKVLAFHTATPKDGGRGALYVYLKRRKP